MCSINNAVIVKCCLCDMVNGGDFSVMQCVIWDMIVVGELYTMQNRSGIHMIVFLILWNHCCYDE